MIQKLSTTAPPSLASYSLSILSLAVQLRSLPTSATVFTAPFPIIKTNFQFPSDCFPQTVRAGDRGYAYRRALRRPISPGLLLSPRPRHVGASGSATTPPPSPTVAAAAPRSGCRVPLCAPGARATDDVNGWPSFRRALSSPSCSCSVALLLPPLSHSPFVPVMLLAISSSSDAAAAAASRAPEVGRRRGRRIQGPRVLHRREPIIAILRVFISSRCDRRCCRCYALPFLFACVMGD